MRFLQRYKDEHMAPSSGCNQITGGEDAYRQIPDEVQFIQSGWMFPVGAPNSMWKVGGC